MTIRDDGGNELDDAAAWIAAGNGSPQLRRISSTGYLADSLAVYRRDRLAAERPGWRFVEAGLDEILDIRNPTELELDVLAAARPYGWEEEDGTSFTVTLRFLRRKHRHQRGPHVAGACAREGGRWTCMLKWNYHGSVLVDTWRGCAIVRNVVVRL
jgi:hypothetical protein